VRSAVSLARRQPFLVDLRHGGVVGVADDQDLAKTGRSRRLCASRESRYGGRRLGAGALDVPVDDAGNVDIPVT